MQIVLGILYSSELFKNPAELKKSVKEVKLPVKPHSFNQTIKVKLPASVSIHSSQMWWSLMVRALNFGSGSPGSSADQGHCFVFFDKTQLLPPGVLMGTGKMVGQPYKHVEG